METAILVDWTLFKANPYTRDFIYERMDKVKTVLLVADPHNDDYKTFHCAGDPIIEFDVVIRNTGDLPNVAFKTTAISVIQEVSNLVPVIGLDSDYEVNAVYREAGVLITIDDL
jgi:hypothetical protein